ncbi:MAG TPA: ATP-binding protein [Terriglobales bacterium]|jgi:signal transduction histidine kinase|nr:ATP-binding protein [Terriglobales bacterium]
MNEEKHSSIRWMDLLWLVFLLGLAVLPPVRESHKQLALLAIGIVQLAEGRVIAIWPRSGRSAVVLVKIVLATLLINHTGQLGINSSYYPIYYVPIVTAAIQFGPWGTLLWTSLASAAYCSYLYPALQEYTLTPEGAAELAIRIMFFFLAAVVVNRFTIENRRKTMQYQQVAEELTEANRRLERAQAEARRSERLAALGQLSAGLAHEIRNPLGVIKGSAETLSRKLENSNPLASELAGYISSEVNRASALVTRFLDFARPLRTETRLQPVTELIDQALKAVGDQWKGGPVVVEREYRTDLPLVPLDENLCEQAFLNLVQNAYEAMGSAGGTFRVEASGARSNGRKGVQVRLQDTGPGVPAEMREQIFNPFVTTKKTGVGLGLSIVSKIVDEHHGTIRLENSDGQGACFVIFFPAEEKARQKAGSS